MADLERRLKEAERRAEEAEARARQCESALAEANAELHALRFRVLAAAELRRYVKAAAEAAGEEEREREEEEEVEEEENRERKEERGKEVEGGGEDKGRKWKSARRSVIPKEERERLARENEEGAMALPEVIKVIKEKAHREGHLTRQEQKSRRDAKVQDMGAGGEGEEDEEKEKEQLREILAGTEEKLDKVEAVLHEVEDMKEVLKAASKEAMDSKTKVSVLEHKLEATQKVAEEIEKEVEMLEYEKYGGRLAEQSEALYRLQMMALSQAELSVLSESGSGKVNGSEGRRGGGGGTGREAVAEQVEEVKELMQESARQATAMEGKIETLQDALAGALARVKELEARLEEKALEVARSAGTGH